MYLYPLFLGPSLEIKLTWSEREGSDTSPILVELHEGFVVFYVMQENLTTLQTNSHYIYPWWLKSRKRHNSEWLTWIERWLSKFEVLHNLNQTKICHNFRSHHMWQVVNMANWNLVLKFRARYVYNNVLKTSWNWLDLAEDSNSTAERFELVDKFQGPDIPQLHNTVLITEQHLEVMRQWGN